MHLGQVLNFISETDGQSLGVNLEREQEVEMVLSILNSGEYELPDSDIEEDTVDISIEKPEIWEDSYDEDEANFVENVESLEFTAPNFPVKFGSDFCNNNRVVVTDGEYRGQHGKILDDITGWNLQRHYQIKLDEGMTVEITDPSLQLENLTQNEVNAEVANLKYQINEVASQLPDHMGKQLPNHLEYLQDALISKNQSRFSNEYIYITRELARAVEGKYVTQQWCETIKIGLEKLKHNMDFNLTQT